MRILIAAAIILASSCSGGVIYFGADPGTPVSNSFESLDDAWRYVAGLEYRTDAEAHGTADYWQSPSETVERGTGDCEDIAILLMHLANRLGYQSALVLTRRHAIVKINGRMLEPQTFGLYVVVDPEIVMAYDQAMSMVQDW
jgi:hypothetical protein